MFRFRKPSFFDETIEVVRIAVAADGRERKERRRLTVTLCPSLRGILSGLTPSPLLVFARTSRQDNDSGVIVASSILRKLQERAVVRVRRRSNRYYLVSFDPSEVSLLLCPDATTTYESSSAQ